MTRITAEQYQQHLAERQQIIDYAREQAPAFHQLTAGDSKYAWNMLSAVAVDDDPKANADSEAELTETEIEFSREYYRCGDTDTDYFTLPTAYLFDPEGWTAQYLPERAERDRAAAEEAARKRAERAAATETAERAQLAKLLARYGTPEATA